MEENATIAKESKKVLKAGEASSVAEPQPKTPQEQFDELIRNNPDLVRIQANGEGQAPPTIANAPMQVKRENRIFILDNEKRKGNVILDMTDDVVFTDPKTGEKKTRRMRLVRGAQSIWQDEQGSLPKEHIAKNIVTLTFERSKCVIPVHETLKIQAALLSNRNTDNENRVGHKDIYFHEWNPEKESRKEEQRQNLIVEAMQIAATAPYEDLIQHAQYLAVPVIDEMGIPLSQTSIRTAYSKKAMNEPEKFLKSIHSPVVRTAHLVRRAINEGIIDLGKQPNQAYFVDGGFITALPQGRDHVEFLIEFASLQGEANEKFVHNLKNLVT